MNNIYLIQNGDRKEIKFVSFSDGAENCVLPELFLGNVRLVVKVEDCTKDIMRMLIVKEALNAAGVSDVHLSLPYIPNARCDRRFNENESFPLKVFTKLINDCNFAKVTVCDSHSDTAIALLDRVEVITQEQGFSIMRAEIEKSIGTDYIICAPDLGATKKAEKVAFTAGKQHIQAYKHRDLSTGQIVSTYVPIDPILPGKDVLIVDDICDGGATFAYLAEELFNQNVNSVSLYVTHGIFAKGLEPLLNFNKIFVLHLNERYINERGIQLFNERQ